MYEPPQPGPNCAIIQIIPALTPPEKNWLCLGLDQAGRVWALQELLDLAARNKYGSYYWMLLRDVQ